MKRLIVISLAIFTLIISGFSQNAEPKFSSNPSMSFEQFIAGVKYAEIGMNSINQEQVDKQTGIASLYYLGQKYLDQMGFEFVALTSSEKTEMDIAIKSYCEYTQVMFGGDITKNSIADMTITFVSCNGDVYSFTSDKEFKYGKFADVEKKLIQDWQSMVKTKAAYKASAQLQLPSNPTYWTKEALLRHFNENKENLAPIEGVYERVRLSFEDISGGKYTVGIIKDPDADGYLVIYLSGAKNSMDWKSGEIKATFDKTATKGFYTVNWISRDKSLYEDVYSSSDLTGFSVYSSGILPISYKFIKTYPTAD